MIETILVISLVLFGIAILITFIRIIIGPTFPDRVIAMDVIGVNLISAIAIVSILFNTRALYDVILVLGILAFISTISFSKFIDRGVIIEQRRDILFNWCYIYFILFSFMYYYIFITLYFLLYYFF